MDAQQCLAYIRGLSDDELEVMLAQAHADTVKAGVEQQDSEWHQSCFCALVVMCQEKNRRTAMRLH